MPRFRLSSFLLVLVLGFHLQSLSGAQLVPGWDEIKPGGDTSCARGDDFSFFVAPGQSDKIVIDFIGGGACWDGKTCDKPTKTFVDTVDDVREHYQRGLEGIYNRNRADNPLRQWTHIVIPYCTGDIHWGAHDVAYTNENGQEFTIRHRGAINAKAVLNWVKEHFSTPNRVLVTGCSAGAYGSIYWTPEVVKNYPQARVVQFADSGEGVVTDNFFQDSFPQWNPTLHAPNWVPGLDPRSNDWQSLTLVDLYQRIGHYLPGVRLGEFSSAYDGIQTFFFEIMGGDPEVWAPGMRHHLKNVSDDLGEQYRYYVSQGEEHCILPYERFYTTTSGPQQQRFSTWFESFVEEKEISNIDCGDHCD